MVMPWHDPTIKRDGGCRATRSRGLMKSYKYYHFTSKLHGLIKSNDCNQKVMPWHDPTKSHIGDCRATPWRGQKSLER
jgi:hypothetical protein